MRQLTYSFAGVCLFVSGCGPAPLTSTNISTDPPGAIILADGKPIGTSPVTYPFEFKDNNTHDVRADLKGYVEADKQISGNSEHLDFALMADDAYDGTVAVPANEATPGPLRIEINKDLTKKDDQGRIPWWVQLNNLVSIRYNGLLQANNETGGLMSQPFEQEFNHPYRGKATVRTQFIGSISTLDPVVYNITIKSEISYKDAPDQWVAYDRVFKEDRDLLARIRQAIEIPH